MLLLNGKKSLKTKDMSNKKQTISISGAVTKLLIGAVKLSFKGTVALTKFTANQIADYVHHKNYQKAIESASSLAEPDRSRILRDIITNWYASGEERFANDIISATDSLAGPLRKGGLLKLRKFCDKRQWWRRAKKIDSLL